jgi:hypothetical protein
MLKQEIAFIKALSTMDFSPALFKELRNALAARGKKKRRAVPAWIRSTFSGGVPTASQQSSAHPRANGKSSSLPPKTLRPELGPHHCQCTSRKLRVNKPSPATGKW